MPDESPSSASPGSPPRTQTIKLILSIILLAGLAWAFWRSPSEARWMQSYDPAHSWLLSALLSMLPLAVLLFCMAALRIKGHIAALIGLATAILIAVAAFHMPMRLTLNASAFGAAYGLFPICWIVLPVLFLYELTRRSGSFALLQQCLMGVTADARIQLLLIAFALGAFFEGTSGFGTPVAVCGTILVGFGFAPVQAAGYALLANTAPVAFGALGIPVIALHGITGLDTLLITRVIGRLLMPFCLIVPFWLVWAFAGFRAMREVLPAILVTGATFAATQLLISTLHGPWLVDIAASTLSIAALAGFLRVWKPRRTLNVALEDITSVANTVHRMETSLLRRAALPWALLALFVVLWGIPALSHRLDAATLSIPLRGLDRLVMRMPPAVAARTAEPAVFTFNWLSATGTGIFLAAIAAGLVMGLGPAAIARVFLSTVYSIRFTLVTIAALMALGFITRFSGMDATLGLAFARTGALYPFFGTLIGWIGTASTGSDTSSNVLFGSLQKLTALQLGISPYLMVSANSTGGVMGKMIAPQSIVVATTATQSYGTEGKILRFVLLHSVAFACLMGLLVSVIAHWPALARWVLS